MKFDPRAFLASHGPDAAPRAKRANHANSPDPFSTNSTFSTPLAVQGEFSPPATVLPFTPPSAPAPSRDDDPSRHGASVTGLPRTWTGRIVSLDEWRTLTDWERHGPNGRLFCAICKAWVQVGAICRQSGCWKAEGGAA